MKIFDYRDEEVSTSVSINKMDNRKLKKLKRKGYCFFDIPDIKLQYQIVKYYNKRPVMILYIYHKTKIDEKILREIEKYNCNFFFNINVKCREHYFGGIPKLVDFAVLDDDCIGFNTLNEDGKLFCIFKNKNELSKFKLKC